MEWELLYMCNIIGLLILILIFVYHMIGSEEEKAEAKAEKAEEIKPKAKGVKA
jgi:formate/nitrite transporter FocA (FNT family)